MAEAKRPKTPELLISNVFREGVWLASAPLHETGKTTKSGNTLKTGIGRGQLGFASDNPSSNPNACPLISTFSKPHSEVASATHTPSLKVFPMKLPLRFTLKILNFLLETADRMNVENRSPISRVFAAGGDVAAVTWSNLPERLKRMECGVNFKADA